MGRECMGIATFMNTTQATDSVYPNDMATLSANMQTVTWQDGTVWTRTGASAQVTVTDYVNSKGVATHLITNGTSNVAFFGQPSATCRWGLHVNAYQADLIRVSQ